LRGVLLDDELGAGRLRVAARSEREPTLLGAGRAFSPKSIAGLSGSSQIAVAGAE